MSNQHIAGVFSANLMTQQKPYDIKGMICSGEVYSKDGKDAKGIFNFFNEDGGYKSLLDGYSNHLNYNYNNENIMNSGFNHVGSIDSFAGISEFKNTDGSTIFHSGQQAGSIMGQDRGGSFVNSDLNREHVNYVTEITNVPARGLEPLTRTMAKADPQGRGMSGAGCTPPHNTRSDDNK